MVFKKRVFIQLITLVLLLTSNILADGNEPIFTGDEDTEPLFTGEEESESSTFETPVAASDAGTGTNTVAEGEPDAKEYQPPTYEPPPETNVEIENIPETYEVETPQGTISSFSMTNALFSLGSLIQGSFISFSANNKLYFNSLFDASTFSATLEEEGTLQVGQKNSFGELGKVIIQIDNGNLTQDNAIIFVPQGNEPTYIYYNSTEIEFKDGDLYLLGESITNNDNSKETTKVNFDENGFTKLQLHPENTYSIQNYNMTNTGKTPLIICKKEPLCDINIDQDTFTLKGKLNLSYKNESIYNGLDENNIFSLDTSTGETTFTNTDPGKQELAYTCVDFHLLIETEDMLYHESTQKSCQQIITHYTSKLSGIEVSIENKNLFGENTLFYATSEQAPLYMAPEKKETVLEKIMEWIQQW